jgi:4-hydroxybutyrate CoA-transferase
MIDHPVYGSRAACDLLSYVRDGDRILVGTGAGEPGALVDALIGSVLAAREGLEVIQVGFGGSEAIARINRIGSHHILMPVPGPIGRQGIREGRIGEYPASMGEIARLIQSGELQFDGVLLSGVRRSDGSISPGLSVDLGPIAAQKARFVALEINSRLPRTFSVNGASFDRAELIVETCSPPPESSARPSSPEDVRIARHVAELVPDGCILEIGVGQALSALALAMIETGRKGLSVHTGLVTDQIADLVRAGAVSKPASCRDGPCVVGTVIQGSSRLYGWVDENRAVVLADSSEAHDSIHLGSLGYFLAINSAAQVDLLGRVGASSWGEALGGGGLRDFATAGALSVGSVIALRSRRSDGTSRIVPLVERAQLPANAVTHVVTEYGIARLQGLSPLERGMALAEISHPSDRVALRRAASDTF